ncbi:MAG: arginine repressor [Oscillospiraceae bacterium]|nr:arginine repressor [Oscillospiraceae bacterium]
MRNKRHHEILEIIKDIDITSQEELIAELRKRSYVVTQSTVSRDISKLGLSKSMSENGVYRYAVPEQLKTEKFEGMLSSAIKKIDTAMNTVVIKTYVGMASAVCVTLEMMNLPEVVGTIAGDDTIFVMTRSEKSALRLSLQLKKLL